LKKMNLADETILEMLSNVTYNLINRLPFLPESSQLSHLKSYYEKQNFVNCHFKDRRLPKEVFEFNNLMNGFTLRNLRSIKSENEYYPKWKSLKEKIAKELSLPTESRNILLPDWKRELVLLESNNLFPISLMKPSSLSCEELKENLKTDEILISFDRFNYFTHHKIDSVFYFARIILPEADDIKQEFLFEERELENLMRKDKSRRADYVARLYNYQNRGVEVEDNERSLFEMIWEPLQPYMKGKNKMHINVSGLLHEINLGAISISEDEVLADVINPVLLSNLNEIQETKRDYKNDFLLVGGLHYDEYKEDLVDPSERTNTTTTNPWKYLKWTAKEVKNIEEQLHTNEEWSGKVLRSKEGTEGAVKSLLKKNHSPRIVHFSTHGYFFSEPDTTQLAYYAQSSNPMIRSGLILSNGNLSWTSLSTKNPHGEDNILTAAEIQSLNLKDTELVVLSACETGLGEVKGSEGVFGMQRAFKLAGAKNIIMSLWQIPDRESSDFMIAFYKHYLEDNLSIRDAFYQTQKEMKDRFYNPYNWAGFVLIE